MRKIEELLSGLREYESGLKKQIANHERGLESFESETFHSTAKRCYEAALEHLYRSVPELEEIRRKENE